MLRITTQRNGTRETRLVVEGRITGPWVEELRRVASECARDRGRLALDLSRVTYADVDGLALLRELLGATARLDRASAFVTALLGGTP